jgi:DNA topoisomerase-1
MTPAGNKPDVLSIAPLESARAGGLRYVGDEAFCIRRVRAGKGFHYIGPSGRTLRDRATLRRIRSLVIPPAWIDVRICSSPDGHLQAIGRDARNRKQYRYHPLYRQIRDEAKFGRLMAFGTTLSLIRSRVQQDLERPGLPREKVLATVVRLLQTSFIRVGNDEYARENDSFGLTTMRSRHVRIAGAKLMFRFRGKSGIEQTVELTDRRLARNVKQCQDLPGYELFRYVDEKGRACRVDSADVNQYIREVTGKDFTAKDFRTWAGTLLAARELTAAGPAGGTPASNRNIVAAVKRVAAHLGNRPATCRKYYIHPAIIDAYSDGSLFEVMREGEQQNAAYDGLGLRPEEYSVMVIVARHQEKLARPRAA